jgi:hypothetical protein
MTDNFTPSGGIFGQAHHEKRPSGNFRIARKTESQKAERRRMMPQTDTTKSSPCLQGQGELVFFPMKGTGKISITVS